jgi:hypothetical protein
MSDIQLPPAELMLLRDLKKTAIVLMLFIRFDPRPLGRNDVVRLLDIAEHTAQKYLDDLSMHGLISRTGYRDGYALAANGKQLLLGQLPTLQQFDKCESANFAPSNDGYSPESANIALSGAFERVESANIAPSETLVVVDINNNSLLVDSTSEPESANFAPLISLSSVLAITPKLFSGSVVSSSGLERIDPMQALKWIAYAWVERENLTAPCGLIYARLKRHIKPPEGVDIHALPNAILKSLGFTVNESQAPDVSEESPIDDLEHMQANETVTSEIIDLWEGIKLRLQEDMPKASFETWVQSTRPVRFDDALWIGARNKYARDWLESKISEVAVKLLSEAECSAPIKFVVTDIETEDDR